MFEAAELGQKLSQKEWKETVPDLRASILQGQFALRESKRSVVIIVSGVDGAGKAMLVHRLNEWLDPRGVATHGFRDHLTDEEVQRPRQWRYWQALPPRGQTAIFFGSWYTWPITDHVRGHTTKPQLLARLERIRFLERMLTQDGVLFLKLWMHLPREQQLANLKNVRKQPRLHWRCIPEDLSDKLLNRRFRAASEKVIRETDTAYAPWHVIEASDQNWREISAGRLLANLLHQSSPAKPAGGGMVAPEPPAEILPNDNTILDQVDLSHHVEKPEYREQLKHRQKKLTDLSWRLHDRGKSAVLVFEGWDAAGKGSAIRRLTQAMDPRLFRVIPIAAPTAEEHAQHYLWRFWRQLPRDGRITIFDRSWYGRILVERIEGFATNHEWLRAYREINEFEEQLAEHGTVICKFWLHVSKEEQLRRFEQRQEVKYKQHKITDEDWRNREKWDEYKAAVNDMVARTSTSYAPWTLVPADDKRHARLQVLKTVSEAFHDAVKSRKKRS
jgi:polyphosphate:AMP phosphotransferase